MFKNLLRLFYKKLSINFHEDVRELSGSDGCLLYTMPNILEVHFTVLSSYRINIFIKPSICLTALFIMTKLFFIKNFSNMENFHELLFRHTLETQIHIQTQIRKIFILALAKSPKVHHFVDNSGRSSDITSNSVKLPK